MTGSGRIEYYRMSITETVTPKSSKLRQRAEESVRRNRDAKNLLRSTAENLRLLNELQIYQIELELQNQELMESRSQLEVALTHYTDLYDNGIAGYFTFDREGIIIKTNLMGASFLGLERSMAIGKHFVNFIVSEESSVFSELIKKVFTTQQKQSCEVSLLRKELLPIMVHIEATIFNQGTECRAVVQDITERIQKEKLAQLHQRELTQVSRVNSMGELASAIAHELNQPLSIILNYVNGCIRRLESNNYKIPKIVEKMKLSAKQVELAGNIVHHMKNLVRQDEILYKRVSINDIAEAASAQLQKESHDNFALPLELRLADNLPLLNADHIQIELVILNLLRNSMEAVRKAKMANPKILLCTERLQNNIVVSITNNGPHYSVDDEIHLFEPCFTTKKNGTGLGLSISRTIVEAHMGRISSHKLPITGVCFQFSLPIPLKEIAL